MRYSVMYIYNFGQVHGSFCLSEVACQGRLIGYHVISRPDASSSCKWELSTNLLRPFHQFSRKIPARAELMDEHKKFLADRLLSEEQPVSLDKVQADEWETKQLG